MISGIMKKSSYKIRAVIAFTSTKTKGVKRCEFQFFYVKNVGREISLYDVKYVQNAFYIIKMHNHLDGYKDKKCVVGFKRKAPIVSIKNNAYVLFIEKSHQRETTIYKS